MRVAMPWANALFCCGGSERVEGAGGALKSPRRRNGNDAGNAAQAGAPLKTGRRAPGGKFNPTLAHYIGIRTCIERHHGRYMYGTRALPHGIDGTL